MKAFKKILAPILLVAFLAGAGLALFAGHVSAAAERVGTITINNPYGFAVRLEVKCDWNDAARSFDFYRKFVVPKHGAYVLVIPKRHSRCQIWPKVVF